MIDQTTFQLKNMDNSILCNIIGANLIQIEKLTVENQTLKSRNNELEKDKELYCGIIEENKKIIKNHEICIEQLKNDNIALNDKITNMENRIVKLANHNEKLENDINELKKIRIEPISIREGFVVLEKFILFEIMGSKKQARKFHIQELFKLPEYEQKCNDFLTKYNLTIEHIEFIRDIKKHGNISAHQKPDLTKEEFENITISLAKDDEDKMFVKDLLKYLNEKIPSKPTELWNIEAPF